MSLLTDYAAAHFKRNIKRDGLQDHVLWSNHMIEWYTLPENLYRAYRLTKREISINGYPFEGISLRSTLVFGKF